MSHFGNKKFWVKKGGNHTWVFFADFCMYFENFQQCLTFFYTMRGGRPECNICYIFKKMKASLIFRRLWIRMLQDTGIIFRARDGKVECWEKRVQNSGINLQQTLPHGTN